MFLLIQIYATAQPKQARDRARVQAVIRRPLTTQSRVQSQVSPRGICDGQSFVYVLRFPSVSLSLDQRSIHIHFLPMLCNIGNSEHH